MAINASGREPTAVERQQAALLRARANLYWRRMWLCFQAANLLDGLGPEGEPLDLDALKQMGPTA